MEVDLDGKDYTNPNPKLYANFLSKLTFGWLTPLFKLGKNTELEAKDLYDPLPEDLSENLGNRLENWWTKERNDCSKRNKAPKFVRVVAKALFEWTHVKYGFYMFLLFIFVRVIQPLILGTLVSFFNTPTDVWDIYICTLSLICCMIFESLLEQYSNFGLSVVGMRFKIGCSSLIYRKVTKLSCSSNHELHERSILNLLSRDVSKLEAAVTCLHHAWMIPLQTVIMVYFMWQRVGIATLFGIGFMMITTIPIESFLGTVISKVQSKVVKITETRLLMISEMISGIKAIKTYVWEKPFGQLITFTRRKEIDIVRIYSYLKGISLATLMFTNLTTLFITLLVYVLQDNALSASTVYSIMYYFYYLRFSLTRLFPNAIKVLIEAKSSLKRIETFLLLDEVQKKIEPSILNEDDKRVYVKNVIAKWTKKSIVDTLNGINISIASNKLYAILGPAGAGKSSFLKLILGELRPNTGHILVSGSVSYVSPDPWIFSGSIRQNILFGEPYDEGRYNDVIKACALEDDFEHLTHGDRTLVGDGGIVLTECQSARVHLARAVYRDADIYLFDEPFRNVDAELGKQLFYECIKGLLKDKTRILVVDQEDYLKDVDIVVFFNNGRNEFQGNYKEFKKNKRVLRYLLFDIEAYHKHTNGISSNKPSLVDQHIREDRRRLETHDKESEESEELLKKKKKKLRNKFIFTKYFRASGSYFLILSTAFFFALAKTFLNASAYWIAFWTDNDDRLSMTALDDSNDIEQPSLDNSFAKSALWILGTLTIGSISACIISHKMLLKLCFNANENIHENMIVRVLKAPMKFFDSNPSGHILDQFSKDINALDESLPISVVKTVQSCTSVIGSSLQIFFINWFTVFPFLIALILYDRIKNLYFETAQNLKRLENSTKRPLVSHMSITLDGLPTIRSHNAEAQLRREFDAHQDSHTAARYLVLASTAAIGLWVDSASLTFVLLASFSFPVIGGFAASFVGLAFIQMVGLCGAMQTCFKGYGGMVEQRRLLKDLLEFMKKVRAEGEEMEQEQLPPDGWPSNGEIRFEGLSLRYSDEVEPALKDINLTIKAGMKIGIVGHNGSGKSSLISALFRLTKVEGTIYIDGIDTQKIEIHRLREKISIVPKEPTIFTASLRQNLDPHERHDDSALWSALDAVDLRASFSSLDCSLHRDDLSPGQRRLLCLARALLQENRVLVLDEPTTDCGAVTDELTRRIVKRHFARCTVLTIAHRLNTIFHSDALIVMDAGRVVEYDKPNALLAQRDGHLVGMVDETGAEMAERIRRIAKQDSSED